MTFRYFQARLPRQELPTILSYIYGWRVAPHNLGRSHLKRFVTMCAGILFLSTGFATSASADNTCFICKSSSSKDKCSSASYCKSESGKDTSDDRKKCREIGCDIGGTGSCPTAANVKVCKISLWDAANPADTMAFHEYWTNAH